jgi:DNA polymerase III alpha subunit
MAKQILKEYWYVNNSLGVIQCDHPGKTKDGNPKPPNKKDVLCWTERGRDVWFFPDGKEQACSEEDYGRSELLAILQSEAAHGESNRKEKSKGQVNMFGDLEETEKEQEKTHKQSGMPKLPDVILSAMERQSLGFAPSGFMSSAEKSALSVEFVGESEIQAYGRDAKYVQIMNSNIGHDPDFPFWRYAIKEEWKDKWKFQWADLVYAEKCEPWRAEVRAFLAVVKDLDSRDVELGDLTLYTVEKIKERFGKKKEEVA